MKYIAAILVITMLFVAGCGNGIAQGMASGDDSARPAPTDLCPDDPQKTTGGWCGCGFPETDTDGDQRPDCVDLCPNDPEKTTPGECGCGEPETCHAETLLVRPLDGIVVLSDLSVWDVSPFLGEPTASRWLADDPIEDSIIDPSTRDDPGDAQFVLHNLRTGERAGAAFNGVGTRLTIVRFQEQEFGRRLVVFNDGTTWGIFFSDESKSRAWRVFDEVIVFSNSSFEEAINLRTGRVIALSSVS